MTGNNRDKLRTRRLTIQQSASSHVFDRSGLFGDFIEEILAKLDKQIRTEVSD